VTEAVRFQCHEDLEEEFICHLWVLAEAREHQRAVRELLLVLWKMYSTRMPGERRPSTQQQEGEIRPRAGVPLLLAEELRMMMLMLMHDVRGPCKTTQSPTLVIIRPTLSQTSQAQMDGPLSSAILRPALLAYNHHLQTARQAEDIHCDVSRSLLHARHFSIFQAAAVADWGASTYAIALAAATFSAVSRLVGATSPHLVSSMSEVETWEVVRRIVLALMERRLEQARQVHECACAAMAAIVAGLHDKSGGRVRSHSSSGSSKNPFMQRGV
jgi:hypothetical protein